MPDPPAYLDHNAQTPLRETARRALLAALDAPPGNSSSVHRFGVLARATLDSARASIASNLGLDEEGLIFTSGGTESNNLAVIGAARASSRIAIATTKLEHPSVLRACASASNDVRFLPLARTGQVDLSAARSVLDDRVAVVAVQAANQETGVRQPIEAIFGLAREIGAHFHCDAAQLVGRAPFDVRADSITLASHKLGGPSGIAGLWVGPNARIDPLLFGGPQERGLRAGTPSPALAAAFAAAVEEVLARLPLEHGNYLELRTRLLSGLVRSRIEHVMLTPLELSIPNTLCIAFPGVDRLALAIQLDLESIAVGLGSACSSGASEISPVLAALGVDATLAASAIRVSLGWDSTANDVDRLLESLPRALALAKAGPTRPL